VGSLSTIQRLEKKLALQERSIKQGQAQAEQLAIIINTLHKEIKKREKDPDRF
jgi:hypothetical protein